MSNIVLYDSVDVSTVPAHAEAVAGYTSGHWPTYKPLVKRFPHAHHLSIAVSAREDADCLDIENGDATPAQAPAWVRRQHARGIKRPVVYASLSVMPTVLSILRADSIPRAQVRVWTAHYTYHAHICTPACGAQVHADATQWTDKALGRNLDESLCTEAFFGTSGARDKLRVKWQHELTAAQKKAGTLKSELAGLEKQITTLEKDLKHG